MLPKFDIIWKSKKLEAFNLVCLNWHFFNYEKVCTAKIFYSSDCRLHRGGMSPSKLSSLSSPMFFQGIMYCFNAAYLTYFCSTFVLLEG